MTTQPEKRNGTRIEFGFLSLLLPGLGQFVARARGRAYIIFFTTFILYGLSVWTIAQRARFPDLNLAFTIFTKLVLAIALLIVFFAAARRVVSLGQTRERGAETIRAVIFVTLFLVVLLLTSGTILATIANPAELAQVYTSTALLAAAGIAALWLWQVADAARLPGLAPEAPRPSMGIFLLLSCLVIFVQGYRITDIDIPKAITEYQDTAIILPRMLWPWQAAFQYDQEVVEGTQSIQAPCPAGETGPASNEPKAEDPWISATPTCGDLGVRDLAGTFTPGTELTITGGNFVPGQVVRILWRNPIGNAFTPRGVGPTDITINAAGEFTTTLNIPDVVVPESTSVGAQIHTLVVRQESIEVFTGQLSQEMELALASMLETIMIGLMATFFGIILAFPLSFLAAKNLMASLTSPMEQVVGSLAGLVAGAWAASYLTGQVAAALGGIAAAPIPIFLIGVVSLLALCLIGLRLGGWLTASLLSALGSTASYWVAAVLLAVMAILPGYWLGLAYSRGFRAIWLGDEVARAGEQLYGYLGAVLLVAAMFAFAYLRRNSRAIAIGLIVYTTTRTILNIVRSIEPLIWAIVASVWVGLGPFAGTIALTLHTIASLAKLYSEAIESIDPGPLEAIEATGATRLQTIIYAVIPQILPPYISFTIYRWDINIRMSTIIGLVGGGGIGFLLIQWIRLYQYDYAGIAIWLITITVATLDYVSSEIRERFV